MVDRGVLVVALVLLLPFAIMPLALPLATTHAAVDPTYEILIYQEGSPSTLYTTANITIVVNDTVTTTTHVNIATGNLTFSDTNYITSITLSPSSYPRIYMYPKWTVNSFGTYVTTVYYPTTTPSMYNVQFFGFAPGSYVSIKTYAANSLIWNTTIFQEFLNIPLVYGSEYSFIVHSPNATYTYIESAGTQTSFGLAPPISIPSPTGSISFAATWEGTYLYMAFSDKNGITGTGTANVLTGSGTTIFSTTITSASWQQNVVLPYSPGMEVYYSVDDNVQGQVSNYVPVVNASQVYTGAPNFNGLNLGFSTVYGIPTSELIATLITVMVAALFSQKYQQLGALVVVFTAALFWFIGWAPSFIDFLSAAVLVGILLFLRRAERPF